MILTPNIEKLKDKAIVELQCNNCNKIYTKTRRSAMKLLKMNQEKTFCTYKCFQSSREQKILVICKNCNKDFLRNPKKMLKSKNNFCSQSCAATYNNKHKTYGNRRSKLESWLEIKLIELYPNVNFLFNDKTTIESELDIYLPDFKLAFELNGIFHYEPIFGEEKLNQIQSNDNNKFQLCQANSISLCIIDTSSIKYNIERNYIPVLNIIKDIINTYCCGVGGI